MVEPDKPGTLSWDYDIPLVSNLFMLRDFLIVIVLALVGMQAALMVVSFIVGEGLVIVPLKIYLIVGGILAVLFLFSAAVVLGNRHRTHFAVSPAGVTFEPGPREKRINRVVLVLSLLGGRPGASLLAVSRESGEFSWSDVRKVAVHRQQRVITLGDAWHPLVRLYCPPESYEQIVDLVQAYAARAATERSDRPHRSSRSWWTYPAWVAGVVVAAFLGMAGYDTLLDDIWRLLILAALLVMGAGLIEAPLVRRLLALAGLLAGGYVLAALVVEATRPITGPSGTVYGTSWEVDTPQLAVSIVGQLVLLGMGVWCLLRARRHLQQGGDE